MPAGLVRRGHRLGQVSGAAAAVDGARCADVDPSARLRFGVNGAHTQSDQRLGDGRLVSYLRAAQPGSSVGRYGK